MSAFQPLYEKMVVYSFHRHGSCLFLAVVVRFCWRLASIAIVRIKTVMAATGRGVDVCVGSSNSRFIADYLLIIQPLVLFLFADVFFLLLMTIALNLSSIFCSILLMLSNVQTVEFQFLAPSRVVSLYLSTKRFRLKNIEVWLVRYFEISLSPHGLVLMLF